MQHTDLELARRNMVLQQIRPWEVIDERVLRVIQQIPREQFVPAMYRSLAFADLEVPLSESQRMMSPKLEARMLQALDVRPANSVLEIGTGSGFVTACLATLGRQVSSVDLYDSFIDTAAARMSDLGLAGAVELRVADAFDLEIGEHRFDRIAITGSLPVHDGRFEDMLSMNGRLFVITGEAPVMEAMLITRVGEDAWRRESLFETELPALEHAPRPEAFDF